MPKIWTYVNRGNKKKAVGCLAKNPVGVATVKLHRFPIFFNPFTREFHAVEENSGAIVGTAKTVAAMISAVVCDMLNAKEEVYKRQFEQLKKDGEDVEMIAEVDFWRGFMEYDE